MKGFTLIELLGVIIILGVISLIIVPITINIIKDNEQKLYDTQLKNIEEGARCLIAKHIFDIELEDNEKIGLRLIDLKNEGCLESSIKNPKDDTEFSNNTTIEVLNNNGDFSYTICVDNNVCDQNITYYGE